MGRGLRLGRLRNLAGRAGVSEPLLLSPMPVHLLLRLEGAAALLGDLAGPHVGVSLFRAAHTYLAPAARAVVAMAAGWGLGGAPAWAARIGADRALGLGLKTLDAFRHAPLRPDHA